MVTASPDMVTHISRVPGPILFKLAPKDAPHQGARAGTKLSKVKVIFMLYF